MDTIGDKNKTLGIHIFTRDLRIKDNKAFNFCVENSDCVLPIFIFTPEQIQHNKYISLNSLMFLIESLQDLHISLNKGLYIYEGTHKKIIEGIVNIIHKSLPRFENILITIAKDYTPYSTKRFKSILSLQTQNKKLFVREIEDYTLLPLNSILTGSGTSYSVFTPFYKNVLSHIDDIDMPKTTSHRLSICSLSKMRSPISLDTIIKKYIDRTKLAPLREIYGGRSNGLIKLQNKYMKQHTNYDKTRDTLQEKTTQLSAYIKYGCVSIREVFYAMMKVFKNKNHSLIRQLLWREFYAHLYYSNPQLLQGISLKEKYDKIVWTGKTRDFNRWCQGKTGFPIIDACMTQLNKTGYMHNRGRLICASFLVKILLVDWKKGEKYFAQKLVDYDPVSNNGGWTWVASNGADSQPYFRILNPWIQGGRHDPECEYIKQWLPQLQNIEPHKLHQWDEYAGEYRLHEIDYVKPIVDYKTQRKQALELYKQYV